VTLYQAWLTIWRKEYDDNTFLILNLLYHDFPSNFLQKCDLVIGPIVMTTNRLAVMDFAEGYFYSDVALIIPMLESSDNNAAAIVHPFQIPVSIIN
jgi:hypothetical protein